MTWPRARARKASALGLGLFSILGLGAAPRIEVGGNPFPKPSPEALYGAKVRTRRFVPKASYAGHLLAMANPPSWKHRRKLGAGVWIETRYGRPQRPRLPQLLKGGQVLHTGDAGFAHLVLKPGTEAFLQPRTQLHLSARDPKANPKRERVRIHPTRGILRVRTPKTQSLEVEMLSARVLLTRGEAWIQVPEVPLDLADPKSFPRFHLVQGRALVFFRSPPRRGRVSGPNYRREFPLAAGKTFEVSSRDWVDFAPRRTRPEEVQELKAGARELSPGEILWVEEPGTPRAMLPRPLASLVREAKDGRPSKDPPARPKPTRPKPRPRPTKKPTRPVPKPPVLDDPFGAPVENDPFAETGDPFSEEDPFEGDPFGGDPFEEDPF